MTDHALSHDAAGLPERPLSRHVPTPAWVGVGLAVALVLVTSATRTQATATLALVAFTLIVLAWRHVLLAWPTLVGLIIAVILFVPIKRYTLGGGVPIALEPYRLLIGLVITGWLGALLVDPNTRLRRTGLEAPILALAGAILLSLVFNAGRVGELTGEVLKAITFFASFFLVMYLVASAVRSRVALDRLLMVLVGGGVLVAVLAIYEWRLGTNYFNNLDHLIPLLDFVPSAVAEDPLIRGGNVRAYASAQHAIALGAALVMLLPVAVYLYRRSGHFLWMAAAGVLTLGALATTSRTAAVMLATELIVFLWLKRKETVRLLPLLLPLAVAVQIAMPGTLGTFKSIFFPEQGLIAEEQAEAGQPGSGRLADLGPSLEEWGREPLFGQGFGTRLTSATDSFVNAKILDDQWLGSLLEIGAVGFCALLWLFLRAVRRLSRRAKEDDGDDGWLFTGLAAAVTAFAVGMLTYDAFSFIQVTFLMFVLLGLGAAALQLRDGARA